MVVDTIRMNGMTYHCTNVIFSQIYHFSALPTKIPAGYYKEPETTYSRMHMEV